MRRRQKPALRSAGRLSSVGLELGLAIVGCLVAGWWLDTKLGTEPYLALGGLILGSVAGFRSLIVAVQRHATESENERL